MSARAQTDYLPIFLIGLLSGVILIGCTLVSVNVTPEQIQSISMSYTDFITVMLTAVTVIITILAMFIAILAIWGYSQFQKLTETASRNHLEKMLFDGPFAKRIETAIIQHISDQIQGGELRTVLAERVDRLILSDASLRADKDQAPSEEKPFTD
ncbi:hypothetical protein NKL07_09640 [Mesorhizobium sp. C280B]|uniref:hypothetical protein n=1 Tax=unclassified Mesorhizobium TaxID=325217 RepID=UPI0012EC67D0|nr:hypothetical protein [Mesorhizobium sp. LSJC280B00]